MDVRVDYKESWVLKNWCFWTVVLERILEHPLDCKEIKPSIVKEISPEYSLKGLMLKLQYFGHLMWRTDSLKRPWCWERLKAGGERDDRGWDGWIASLTQWTWVWASSESWWWTGKPLVLQSLGLQKSNTTERLNWTELNWRWERITRFHAEEKEPMVQSKKLENERRKKNEEKTGNDQSLEENTPMGWMA